MQSLIIKEQIERLLYSVAANQIYVQPEHFGYTVLGMITPYKVILLMR